MEKILELIAVAIYRIDNALYKTFGFVSPFREQSWALSGKRLQEELDHEHSMRDRLNDFYDTDYTTRQALTLRKR